jgi:hypothetical protein
MKLLEKKEVISMKKVAIPKIPRKVSFHVLTNHKCSEKGCERLIKLNVVARKGTEKPLQCYKHYQAGKKPAGHPRHSIAGGCLLIR